MKSGEREATFPAECWCIRRLGLRNELTHQIDFSRQFLDPALLAGLQKVLAPPVVKIGADALTTAQLCNAVLAAKPLQHDSDLLFSGETASRLAPDVLDRFLCRLSLRHRNPPSLATKVSLSIGKDCKSNLQRSPEISRSGVCPRTASVLSREGCLSVA